MKSSCVYERFRALYEGKKLRHCMWDDDEYICMRDGYLEEHTNGIALDVGADNIYCKIADTTEDWEIVE